MTTATAQETSKTPINDPFVTEGADNTTISAQDMLKLLDSLKLDPTDTELQALVEMAKNGQPVERDTLMTIVGNLLSENSASLGELTGSIGDFEIEFK